MQKSKRPKALKMKVMTGNNTPQMNMLKSGMSMMKSSGKNLGVRKKKK